jgi:hypothetical protein
MENLILSMMKLLLLKFRKNLFLNFGILFTCLGFSVSYAEELKSNEEIVGYYLSSIQLANEFKKSHCGKYISIEEDKIDLDAITKEVLSYLSPEEQKQFHFEITPKFIQEQSISYRKLFDSWSLKKCKVYAKKYFWLEYNESLNEWLRVKAELIARRKGQNLIKRQI